MAIAQQDFSFSIPSPGSSATFAHVVASGEYLTVTVACHNVTCSGVTYNGDAMTQSLLVENGTYRGYIFTLSNPDTGTNNVIVTMSGSSYFMASAVSYSGVNNADAIDNTTSTTGTSGDSSLSITTNYDNSFLIDVMEGEYTGFATPAASAPTSSNVRTIYAAATDHWSGDGYRTSTTAGSYQMKWTWSESTAWAHGILALRESVASATIKDIIGGGMIVAPRL